MKIRGIAGVNVFIGGRARLAHFIDHESVRRDDALEPLRADLLRKQVLHDEPAEGAVTSAGVEKPDALLPDFHDCPGLKVVRGEHEESIDAAFKKLGRGRLPIGVRREDCVALLLEAGEERLLHPRPVVRST